MTSSPPAPARRWIPGASPFAGLVHLTLALWVFRGCLTPGLFPYGRDTVSHDILFFAYGWETVRDTGIIPLWNHQLFAGWPWVAAAGWTPWYPPHWIALVAPIAFAFTMQYVLHHAWAGLGFTVWGRALGLPFGPALLGGVLFQMSGHVTTLVYPGHLAKFEAIAWLPWVMALSHGALRMRSRRAALWTAVCLAMQILTQHAQIVYYTVGLLLALTLWHWMRRPKTPAESRRSLRPLRFLALVGFLGAGLAMVQLLPAAEMIRVSNRADGVSFEEATETSYPPEELVELVWPGLFGSSVDGTYHGRWGERLVSDYLGLVTVIGVILAVIFAARGIFTDRRTSEPSSARVLALLALLALTLVLALGKYTPLYGLLYAWIPGWDRWRSPATIMAVTTFAACTLAALGWSAAMTWTGSLLAVGAWRAMPVLLILAATTDQIRVAQRHVMVSGGRLRATIEQSVAAIPLDRTQRQFRSFLFTQEMSNLPLFAPTLIITGYHPIVLHRLQRLFETLGYDSPHLHRLLAVRQWFVPAGTGAPGFEPTHDTRSGIHLRSSKWDNVTAAAPGQLVWLPGTTLGADSKDSALRLLEEVVTERWPDWEIAAFSAVAVEGLETGKEPLEWHPGVYWGIDEENVTDEMEALNMFRIWLPNHFLYPLESLLGSVASSEEGMPPDGRWMVISQIIAPGWRVHALRRNSGLPISVPSRVWASWIRKTHTMFSHPEFRTEDLKVWPAWGALWAVRLRGGEDFLYAQYRPATIRLGLFVSLASLVVALALLLRVPKTRRVSLR